MTGTAMFIGAIALNGSSQRSRPVAGSRDRTASGVQMISWRTPPSVMMTGVPTPGSVVTSIDRHTSSPVNLSQARTRPSGSAPTIAMRRLPSTMVRWPHQCHCCQYRSRPRSPSSNGRPRSRHPSTEGLRWHRERRLGRRRPSVSRAARSATGSRRRSLPTRRSTEPRPSSHRAPAHARDLSRRAHARNP